MMSRVLAGIAVVEALVIVLLLVMRGGGDEARGAPRGPGLRELGGVAETEAVAPEAPQPAEPEPTPPPAAAAETDCVLYGHLLSSAGGPARSPVWVQLVPEGGKARFIPVQDDSTYAIAGLAPGRYSMTVSGQAYDEARAEIVLAPGTTRRDFVLAAAIRIPVRVVTPDGEAFYRADGPARVGGLSAVVTREPVSRLPMTELMMHTRFGIGEFRTPWAMRNETVPEGVIGILMAKATPPFHVSLVYMHFVVATQVVTGPVDEVRFVLRPEEIERLLATVTLRVVDATSGEPLPGSVSISDRQSSGPGSPIGKDGVAVCERVPPGLKELMIWAKDHESVCTYVHVPEGGPLDLGTWRLGPAGEIRGEVLDADGEPLATDLVARNLDRMDFPQPLRQMMRWRSDTEGKFKVPGVGRGRYVIVVEHDAHAVTAVLVDTTGGSVDDVRIRMRPGTPVRLVPVHDGLHDFLLTVRDARGLPLKAGLVRGEWPWDFRLVPGDYTLEIAEDGVVRKTLPLEVGGTPVVLALER